MDDCGDFMVAGEEGSVDALRCAACGCHHNFLRKESDSPTVSGLPPRYPRLPSSLASTYACPTRAATS
jgi:hypothetical protein